MGRGIGVAEVGSFSGAIVDVLEGPTILLAGDVAETTDADLAVMEPSSACTGKGIGVVE